MKLTLRGDLPSKKNRVVAQKGRRGNYAGTIGETLKDLAAQAAAQWRDVGGKMAPLLHPNLEIRLHLCNWKKDRDNIYTALLDVLKAAGVIVDDNVECCNGMHVLQPVEPVDDLRLECAVIEVLESDYKLPESRQPKVKGKPARGRRFGKGIRLKQLPPIRK